MFISHFGKIFEKPSYWRYWLAYTLSAIGFELILFLLMVIVFDWMKTALSMGTFTAIFMFCLVVFGPLAGLYVDRWDKKNIFLACNVLLAVLIFILKYVEEIFWLYSLWFLASLLFTFLRPVRVALIANLFSKEDYLKANSAFMMSLNLSKIGGPLIGGFLILSFSREWVGNIILFFFLISCIFVSTLDFRPSSPGRLNQEPPKWNWRVYTRGLRFILSHEGLRFYILIGLLWRLFLASQLPLYIVFVKNYIGGGTQEYSLFMTILALGGAVGSILAGSLENLCSQRTMIYGGLAVSYILFALLPVSQNFLLALSLIGLSNLAFYVAHVAMHADIQKITPNEIRGTVFASAPAILIPVGLISIYIATPLADQVGVQWIFLFSGLMALATLPMVGYMSKGFSRILQRHLKAEDY